MWTKADVNGQVPVGQLYFCFGETKKSCVMDEKTFQYSAIGLLVLLFLMLVFVTGAVVGGEKKTTSVTTKGGTTKPKTQFLLFGKKILTW